MTKKIGQANSEAEKDLEAALLKIEAWKGRCIEYEPMSGGISNSNWRIWVEGEGGSFFIKIPGKGTEMFIDRQASMDASMKASALGLGPKVYDYLADEGVEINTFVVGRRACTHADFRMPARARSAIEAYKILHGAERFILTKTVFDMIDEHIEQVRSLGGWNPPDFEWLCMKYENARSAFLASGLDLVPCFNDPMAGNFLVDDKESIMLIDFEYASNNDRCYDLGIWFGEMFFDLETERNLTEHYFGHVREDIFARITVHKALADIKWATWSMVQNKVSALDFDFFKYGAWKHMRARSVLNNPLWDHWLKQI